MALPVASTTIAAVGPYIGAGKRKVWFVPTIVNIASPLLTELNAGTDITNVMKPDGMDGFSTSADSVDAGNYGTRKTGQVPGMITFADSSLDFNADKAGVNMVSTLMPLDQNGFIVDYFAGVITGGKMNVYSIGVKVSQVQGSPGGEIMTYHTEFAILDSANNVTIPTS